MKKNSIFLVALLLSATQLFGAATTDADIVNRLIIDLTRTDASDAKSLATIRDALETGKLTDINTLRPTGTNLLHWAAYQGYPETTTYLLMHGANPTIKSRSGMTALDIAEYNNHKAIINILAPITPTASRASITEPSGSALQQVLTKRTGQKITQENIRTIWKELTPRGRKLTAYEVRQLVAYASDPEGHTNLEKNPLWRVSTQLIRSRPNAIEGIGGLNKSTINAWNNIAHSR